MSNEYFGAFISPSTLTALNAESKGLFTVPTLEQNDTLYVKSETEKKWRELLEVRDTKVEPSKDKIYTIFTVQYRVSDEGYPQPNKGRIMTKNYWVNMTALEQASHEDHKKAKINMRKVVQLMQACGVQLPELNDSGNYDFAPSFNGSEGDKPLVGKNFWGIMRDYVYESRKDGVGLVNDQDVDRFISIDK